MILVFFQFHRSKAIRKNIPIYTQGGHNALKSTVNRKGQKRRIWLLPTQTLSYGEPKFIVILLPCHTMMLKSYIMKYFTFEINLLGKNENFVTLVLGHLEML